MSDLSYLFYWTHLDRVLSSVLPYTFSSVGHVFPVKTKIIWRDSRLRIMLSYVHCIQLFSEVEIIHMHTKTNKHNVMWFRGS